MCTLPGTPWLSMREALCVAGVGGGPSFQSQNKPGGFGSDDGEPFWCQRYRSNRQVKRRVFHNAADTHVFTGVSEVTWGGRVERQGLASEVGGESGNCGF